VKLGESLGNNCLAASIKLFYGVNHSITISARPHQRSLCAELFVAVKRPQNLIVVVNPRAAIVLCRWHKEKIIVAVPCARVAHARAQQCCVEKLVTIC
jgi:hypothetical protein